LALGFAMHGVEIIGDTELLGADEVVVVEEELEEVDEPVDEPVDDALDEDNVIELDVIGIEEEEKEVWALEERIRACYVVALTEEATYLAVAFLLFLFCAASPPPTPPPIPPAMMSTNTTTTVQKAATVKPNILFDSTFAFSTAM